MIRLRLTPDTIGPVSRGHPWVYAEGIAPGETRPPTGTVVQVADERGRAMAFGLADDGPIAVRLLGRHPVPLAGLVAARVMAAASARAGLLPADTDAWRVVNGEGDGLPGIVVDRYGDVAVIRLYSGSWEPHLDAILAAVAALPFARTILRRFGVRGVDGRDGVALLHGPEAAEPIVVREAGLQFLVRPSVGQKTGLFLDQRENRRCVGAWSDGRTVANLFGYNGGFSVHAAAGGARRVVTVDVAGDALADARENFRINGLDPSRHAFEKADVFAWVGAEAERFDLLVCDPPSLAHGKGADAAARRAYRDLAEASGRRVADDGLLATASCTARLSTERWEQEVRDGLRKVGRWAWLWRSAEPPDHPVSVAHPEGRYLKFALLRRIPSAG